MSFRVDTAVLVLAAGPGTRMRSDTPKVLHTLAGRSMLSHSLHAITKVAPQRLVVVLGHEHQRITPLVAGFARRVAAVGCTAVLPHLFGQPGRPPHMRAPATTVLHQPFVNPNDVKWRFADQRATAILNCAAQADIVRASALCRVVR